MTNLRRICLWAALAAMAALIVLCIVGAFLGAEGASAMFNSTPLAAFWIALLMAVAASTALSGSLRQPGTLAMHLGCAAILAAGLLGSQASHRLKWGGQGVGKVRKGHMVIATGGRESRILDEHEKEIGRLDCQIELRNLWLQYHRTPWLEVGFAPAEPGGERRTRQIEWTIDAPADLPGTDVKIRVFKYFRRASVGKGLELSFVKDRSSSLPACEVEVTRGQSGLRAWLFARPGQKYAELPLAQLYDDDDQWRQAGRATLLLVTPVDQVRDSVSHVAVIRDGRAVEHAGIRVNHPLHVDGYHIYQIPYRWEFGTETRLLVVSDRGLYVAYAGFALLAAGAFVTCWVVPAWGRVGRRRRR